MNPNPDAAARPPRLALLIATGFGLGYLPKAPGTWGSLACTILMWAWPHLSARFVFATYYVGFGVDSYLLSLILLSLPFLIPILLVGLVGVWAASRAAHYFGATDPQRVVIDEISGQQVALFGAGFLYDGWKYFLLGFILFRVFDIWKPFPVRQAESLPGGWGIMADDWIAGLYAALGLWVARGLGL